MTRSHTYSTFVFLGFFVEYPRAGGAAIAILLDERKRTELDCFIAFNKSVLVLVTFHGTFSSRTNY